VAKQLNEFPQTRGRVAGSSKFPWDQWFNGKIWQLDNGEDFTATKTENFRTTVGKAAKDRGIKVKTAVTNEGKSLVVQALLDK
jgi:hypothetical protein